MPDFNVDLVKLKAEQIVLKSPADIDSARLVYLEEIMDWSEYYTEADQSIQVFEAIINLWIQFASFEQSLNQFKKTVELYDKAIIDPIASKSCKIFKAYITFYVNRNKYNNAQKIFIKSLCAGFNEEDNRSLWLEYLQMMHRVNKSTVLTLPQLYHAVKSQLNEASGLQLLASLPSDCHSIDNSSTFVNSNVTINTGTATTTTATAAISSSSSINNSSSNVSNYRNSSINPINNNTNSSSSNVSINSSSDNSFIDALSHHSNSKGPEASLIVVIKTEDTTSQFIKPQTEVKVETLVKKEIFTTTTTTTTTMNDAVAAVTFSAAVVNNEHSRIVTAPHAVAPLNDDGHSGVPPHHVLSTTSASSLLSSSNNTSNVLHHVDNINDVVNHNYHDISSTNSSRDINSHIAIDSVVGTGMIISNISNSSSSSHSDHMIIDDSTMHAILHPTAHPPIDNSMMYANVDDLDDVTGLTPKQIIRIFYARPPMIFTAHYKEPISLGLNILNEDKRKELERYLSMPFARLIDYELPSTRQLSGQQQQQQRTSNISINNVNNVDDSKWIKVDNVLDLLESLWMIQSLKERHFDSWIRDLRIVHMTNESDLMEVFRKNNESNCNSDEDRKQERKKQQVELERFHSHCNMQQELLYALINKSLFALLIEQQNILSSIGFPSFSSSFIDKLLNHISQLKGKSMGGSSSSSSSSKVSFELDGMIVSQLSLQRTLVCALLSVRLRFTIPPITQHHQHLNINDININPLINNNNSINNNNNNNSNEVRHDDNAMKIEHEMNNYNVELRKKRKRRRPFNSHSNSNNSNNNGSSSDGLSYYQRQPSISPSYIPLEQQHQHQHQRYQHSSLHQSTYQLSSSTSTGTPLISQPLSSTYFNHL